MPGPATPREPGASRRGSGSGRGQAGRGRAGRPRGTDDRRTPTRRLSGGLRLGVMTDPADVVGQSKQFRVVEADAGLEALVERMVTPWIESTPEGFVVDVRAHRLLTQHGAPPESLWPE